MTLAEENIIVGGAVQTGGNRWGDYAHMTIDPIDDATFWYTGMYIGSSNNQRKTRIASFKIASDEPDDLGVVSIDNPTNGILTANETVSITIYNFGTDDQSNFPVAYTVNGGAPVIETYTGTIISGTTATYSFTAPANMSTPGYYAIKAYTSLVGDAYNPNDTTFNTVQHLFSNDVGVTAITAPNSGTGLSANSTITVTLENFGASTQTTIPVSYSINGGTVVTQNYVGSLAAGANTSFSFTTTSNLSSLGMYSILAYTSLSGDSENSNDTTYKDVEHFICQPQADCSFGDGLTQFKLGTINNNTSCSPQGFGDYTNLNTNLERGTTHVLSAKSGYANQVLTVWIDYNDNFVFESSEIVLTNAPFGTTLVNMNVPISGTAALGQHLLRARTNWTQFGSATITDPCVDVSYGETEDYKVTIAPFTSVDEQYNNVNFFVTDKGDGTFILNVEGLNEEVNIEIHNTIGQKVMETNGVRINGTFQQEINLSGNARGYYLVRIGNNNFSKIQKITLR
jgi:hypothetical protein